MLTRIMIIATALAAAATVPAAAAVLSDEPVRATPANELKANAAATRAPGHRTARRTRITTTPTCRYRGDAGEGEPTGGEWAGTAVSTATGLSTSRCAMGSPTSASST